MIKLKRLEVEGGFLNGVDLPFSDGLNVLIGARGSGKTSVVELLRFCLNVRAVTDRAQRDAERQALWVLGEDGCASLTIEIDGAERVVRRGVNLEPEIAVPKAGILFVSQMEIEQIGRNSAGRRRILDDAAGQALTVGSAPGQAVNDAAKALHGYRTELEEVAQRLVGLVEVPDLLSAAEEQQLGNENQSEELIKLQEVASSLSDELGDMGTRADGLEVAAKQASEWQSALKSLRTNEPEFDRLTDDVQVALAEAIDAMRGHVDEAIQVAAQIEESLSAQHGEATTRLNAKRRELADVSTRIDELEEGAGKLSRQVSTLREQDKHREHLLAREVELKGKIRAATEARATALEDLAAAADERYQRRRETANALNDEFAPSIRVDVVKAGEVSDYERALGEALQGSKLQWRALAKRVSERMSPRELVAAIEKLDVKAVESGAGISEDRAKRLVTYLTGVDTTGIVLAHIDEEVEFSLLDGTEVKSTERLSLGQRCTVVLPLLLARDPDLAILDQPEDHLDNAFIVDTVVDALKSRRDGAQRLVATHNANIPVLGEADRVFVMQSSGSEAFVPTIGELDAPAVRESITKLMEGGEEAFRRRAEFYGTT